MKIELNSVYPLQGHAKYRKVPLNLHFNVIIILIEIFKLSYTSHRSVAFVDMIMHAESI